MRALLQDFFQKDPDLAARARILVAFSNGAFLATVIFVPIFYYLGGVTVATFAAIDSPLIGLTRLVLRWSRSVRFSAHYYLLSVWSFITGIGLLLGGASAPGLPAYGVLILGAAFMIGRRASIFWTTVCVVTVIAIELVLDRWQPSFVVPEDQLTLLSVLGYCAVLTLVCVFALIYDSSKEGAMSSLRHANQRISQTLVELEEASARLVRSSEHVLGSSDDPERGLVGQMMQTARAGQHKVGEARNSIQGMIEQYRQISDRVQELYRYSQTIVELVSTIDRISARLDIMALNVGIEAAQSGSTGKQFSILAEDMRLLAERVLNETTRIKIALQRVNKQVREVQDSSAQGEGLTEESARRLAAMMSTFDELYAFIQKTEGSTEELTGETLRQLETVRKLMMVASAGKQQ